MKSTSFPVLLTAAIAVGGFALLRRIAGVRAEEP